MLFAASTRTRASVVFTFGSTMGSEPSFAVPAASVVGNVLPPSVESRMFTLAVFTGATLVFATSHVTVCAPASNMLVLGEVTRNGPALALTVTDMLAIATPPQAARLSRAVTRKLSVRLVVGRYSPLG